METLPASCHSMLFVPICITLLMVCITFLHVPLESGETGREMPQCDLGIRGSLGGNSRGKIVITTM